MAGTPTLARLGFGSKLSIGDGAGPEVFAVVGDLKSINGPNQSRGQVEVTHMDSPDGYVEYIGDLKDGGEVSFTVNFAREDAGQAAVFTAFGSGRVANFRLQFPNPTSGKKRFEFAAYVSNLSNSFPVRGAMEQTITLKIARDVQLVNDV